MNDKVNTCASPYCKCDECKATTDLSQLIPQARKIAELFNNIKKKNYCKNGVCDLNMFDFCRCDEK